MIDGYIKKEAPHTRKFIGKDRGGREEDIAIFYGIYNYFLNEI